MKAQKCPICDGHGLVAGGFYQVVGGQKTWSSTNCSEPCQACNGTGIIYIDDKKELSNA